MRAAAAIAKLQKSQPHAIKAVQKAISFTTTLPNITSSVQYHASYDGSIEQLQKIIDPVKLNMDQYAIKYFILQTLPSIPEVATAGAIVIESVAASAPIIVLENKAALPDAKVIVIPTSSMYWSVLEEAAEMEVEELVTPWALIVCGTILLTIIGVPSWVNLTLHARQ